MKRKVYEAIAKDLNEFGYPDVTWGMIKTIHESYKQGKRESELPHGVIGMFAQSHIEDATERGFL